ncbi:MAG TPA: hypothetical protein VN493_21350 [Thermoanaerobaculia bacterium]|nr:hypothetical protein [Thermoanaerobaculia bacterium]
MSLSPHLLAKLGRYRCVLVVGPQRAGTTIAAQMIARDLESVFLDERDVEGDIAQRIDDLRRGRRPCVVQAPAWTFACHELGRPDTAVVLVRRRIEEILDSQERIGWTAPCQPRELRRYGATSGVIAEIKYRAWDEHQRRQLGPHGFELRYTDLDRHELWIPARGRGEFQPKQTAPEE